MNNRTEPILYIVIPCYNEQEVLPITAPMFLQKINDLAAAGKISPDSRVLFVNDGSKDRTWEIINELAASDEHYVGICQSRNRGHQNAVLAGLMEAKSRCDITISIDCDGQDDINAMDGMVLTTSTPWTAWWMPTATVAISSTACAASGIPTRFSSVLPPRVSTKS